MLAISHPVNQINTAHAAGSAASQDVEAGHAAPAQRSPLPRQAPPAGLPARPGQRRASEVIRMLKCAVATLGVLGGALMSGAGVLANASTSNADGQYDPTPIAGAAGASNRPGTCDPRNRRGRRHLLASRCQTARCAGKRNTVGDTNLQHEARIRLTANWALKVQEGPGRTCGPGHLAR